jgi:hypothetical protein
MICTTRDGKKIKIICVDKPRSRPVVVYDIQSGETVTYIQSGLLHGDTKISGYDLIDFDVAKFDNHGAKENKWPEDAPEWANYIVTDADGVLHYYERKPFISNDGWFDQVEYSWDIFS